MESTVQIIKLLQTFFSKNLLNSKLPEKLLDYQHDKWGILKLDILPYEQEES